ncbi:MAG: electron transfer flavoprotein subunit alpha/FixB family protein [Gemmatimonadota bacterium]|nr:electron transfer flavoprotein subunit alpha/FixB family protein [Gemmatimonadota bacterium]
MADFMVFAETRGGNLRTVALETVSAARQAADASGGGTVHALVCGAAGVAGAAEALAAHGADQVHVVEHPQLAHYNAESVAATAAALIQSTGARAALFSASVEGRDLAPRVAAKLGVGLAADVTAFEVHADHVTATHPVYTGKAVATLRLVGTPAVLSIRPGAQPAVEHAGKGEVSSLAPALDPAAARVVVTEVGARGAAKLDLGEAPVVVAGGRGLRAAEHFSLMEDLAAAFGNAAVGATRAVTDDGWRDPADQIGQTGRLVSPDLYVAVGISGAVQHLAGMRTSRVIVAINRDKDAPIFKVADYGIVGDLFEIVPRLIEEIRARKAAG